MSSGELLSLHVGQAGVQIGSAVWELLCLEHSIYPNGLICGGSSGQNVVFSESQADHAVPRAVFCDLDPSCIDEIRSGAYKHLFGMDYLITGKEDASSNYARGYYSLGNEYSELCLDRLRKQAEKCKIPQGIFIFRSFGGGTGSGLTANIMNKIRRDFPKLKVWEFSVYPAPRISTVITEPYNAVLTTHATMETSDCNFLFDNEAVYDICLKKLGVSRPTYTNLNRLIAQMVSCISCSSRFPCDAGSTLSETLTNLIPFPRLHFPLVSYAPFSTDRALRMETAHVSELVSDVFRPDNQMVKLDPKQGKYLSSVLLFRGDISPVEVNEAVGDLKQSKLVNFVDYSAGGFKVGGCQQPMRFVNGSDLGASPASVVCMSNCTAVGSAWERLANKFDMLFSRRAFVHHYVGEGMEEAEFSEAREDIRSLIEAFNTAGEDDAQAEEKEE